MIRNWFSSRVCVRLRSTFFLSLLLAFIVSSTSLAQDSLNLSLQFRELQQQGQVWFSTLDSNTLYEGVYTVGVKAWNVSNRIAPQYLGLIPMDQGFPMYCVQNYFYVFSPGADIRIYNRTYPISTIEVARFATGGHPSQMAILGQIGYISDRNNGLLAVNLANPSLPALISRLPMPDNAEGVSVQGNYAYVCCWYSGFRIVDVSHPDSMREVGVCMLPGLTRKCAVSGNIAYVANYQSGLKIVDISDPANPTVIQTWYDQRGGTTHDVLLSGDTLFVGNAAGGLYMLDVSTPSNPQVIGWYYNSYPVGLTKVNNLIYCSDFRAFSVYSIMVPELRVLTPNGGEQYDGSTTDTLRWAGNYIPGSLSVSINLNYPDGEWIPILESIRNLGYSPWYIDRVNTTHARIRIMSDEMPELFDESDGDFEIHTDGIASGLSELPDQYKVIVSPNPFNSSTAITLELPTTSDVKLSIFDVTGKTIALLHSGRLSAGNHRIQWHAPVNLASGVYFHRTEIGTNESIRASTGKLLLIR